MKLDLYNPEVPRLFVAEAKRDIASGETKATYLAAIISIETVLDWLRSMSGIPKGYAGVDTAMLHGRWGRVDLNAVREFDVHIQERGGVKLVSPTSSHETVWFEATELADVFVAPAKPIVILGTPEFKATTGRAVQMQLEKTREYARILRALEERSDGSDDVIALGPFIGDISSSLKI